MIGLVVLVTLVVSWRISVSRETLPDAPSMFHVKHPQISRKIPLTAYRDYEILIMSGKGRDPGGQPRGRR
jgi:hypothetical protein